MSNHLITILQDSNPVPNAGGLADSDEARELAMRRPGSIINWRARDDEYAGDGYWIRLLEPSKWDVCSEGATLAEVRSLKTAFAIAERHRRESIRRRDLVLWAGVLAGTIIGALLIGQLDSRSTLWWVLVAAVFYAGAAATVRFLVTLGGNVNDPYRRPLPWERRHWWRRLLGR